MKITLLISAALAITGLFTWALWKANHLDENTKFLAWIGCTWRGKHRPARHPLGGFICLDCLLTGDDMHDMGYQGGAYVDPRRKSYTERRGEPRTSIDGTGYVLPSPERMAELRRRRWAK